MSQERIAFSKMHALSNDFVVINAVDQAFDASADWIREAGDRHRGIGFDQLLVIRHTDESAADFGLEIYNSDGNAAEQCGNGTLCVARYVLEEQLETKSELRFKTLGGLVVADVLGGSKHDNTLVRAELGVPSIEPERVPFVTTQASLSYELALEGNPQKTINVTPVGMGNPHAVIFVDESETWDYESVARAVQAHDRFPASANVEFVDVCDSEHIRIRVFERGAGETMACGTGACAATTAAKLASRIGSVVHAEQDGGIAKVEWPGIDQPISLTAETSRVFDGEIRIGEA